MTRQLDPETLRHFYITEGQSIRAIAQLCRCRPATVIAAMNEAGIARRRTGPQRAGLPDWDVTKLRLLVKACGMPYVRAFARANGVNAKRLAALLGEQPLDRGMRSSQVVVDHDAAIRAAFDAGLSIRVLSMQYRCSRRAIGYSLDRTSGTNGQLSADISNSLPIGSQIAEGGQ